MFARTRARLTLLYVVLFALVITAFSVAFYFNMQTALIPDFDLGPELTNQQAAEVAYHAAIDRIRDTLIVADLLVVAFVGSASWILAARTLAPIRVAHARQRRFVADASHEMRNPLAAIRASAENALLTPSSEAALRDALSVVVRSTDRLTRLTNDLLALARADEPPPEQAGARMDVSVVVAETLEAFAAAHADLPRPRITLAADLSVKADPDEITRIVENLVDNAYRYGPRGGSPRLVTRHDDGHAIIEVSDDGPGIRTADVERIFEPFARLDSTARPGSGTGLGLAIAQSLAIRSGGRLELESSPGEGATFRLALPILK